MKRILSTILVIVGVLFFSLWGGCKKKEENKLTIETKPITEITSNSAKCGGIVTVVGNYTIGACGVCWNETPSPTIYDSFTTDIQGADEYTSLMKNLKPATHYFVRAYATTSSGIMYGEELDFTTEAPPAGDITVYTNEIVEITSSTARCGGVVTSNGDATVSQRGVCWSTSSNPTISGDHTEDGQGLGSFSSTMTMLTESARYFVRAYAVTDDGVTVYGDEKQFICASNGSNDSVLVYTNEVSDITTTSVKCGGVVSVIGNFSITARGVCWNISPNPTVSGAHTTDGQGTGSFTSNVTGLSVGTLYFIRAYATTSTGNTVYGDYKTFMTEDGGVTTVPTVVMGELTDVMASSAKCVGSVVSEGGASVTERGFCWNTAPNPTVSHSHVNCGLGIGEFEGQLTGLEIGTTYYVRAYATNSEGTNYSEEEKTFTTDNGPSVTTDPVTQVMQFSATCSGSLLDDGGFTVLRRGFCWGTSLNPTVDDNVILATGNGLGNFSKEVDGQLTPNTHYYIRAFAKNSKGIGYGENREFTTLPALYYGDGTHDDDWGSTNGGVNEWAVMFPVSMLGSYQGTKITGIRTYIKELGDYTLNIYVGGDKRPSDLVLSLNYSFTQKGWKILSLGSDALLLDTQENLWVSLLCSSEAGQHPCASGPGINDPNARWKCRNGSWYDMYNNNNNVDLCWVIHVLLNTNAKNGTEMMFELPVSSGAIVEESANSNRNNGLVNDNLDVSSRYTAK